jgi:hypothetical protein
MAFNIMGGVSGISVESDPTALKIASNLADLPNKPTARSNLGLGSMATAGVGQFQSSVSSALGTPFPVNPDIMYGVKNGSWVPLAANDALLYSDTSGASAINGTYSFEGYDSSGQYYSPYQTGEVTVGNDNVVIYRADGDFTGNWDSSTEIEYYPATGPSGLNGDWENAVASWEEYDSSGYFTGNYIYVYLDGSGGFYSATNPNNPPY